MLLSHPWILHRLCASHADNQGRVESGYESQNSTDNQPCRREVQSTFNDLLACCRPLAIQNLQVRLTYTSTKAWVFTYTK